jgi:hypothetical protein
MVGAMEDHPGLPLILPAEDYELPWFAALQLEEAKRLIEKGKPYHRDAGMILTQIERRIGITMEQTIAATKGRRFQNGTARKVAPKPLEPLGKQARKAAAVKRSEALRRAQDFAAFGLQWESSSLANLSDVEIDRTSQINEQRGRRRDVFAELRNKMAAGAYDSCRRLEKAFAVQFDELGSARVVRVDNGAETGKGKMDNMIAAKAEIEAVLKRVGMRDAWLLAELCHPSDVMRMRCPTWREVVAHITGEDNLMSQSASVQSAAANLTLAYEEFDREDATRKKREAAEGRRPVAA